MTLKLSDQNLIEKFRQTKNANYFKSLVSRYQNRVYGVAYKILGNYDEAEEAVQETYIKVHQNLDKFRRIASFDSWLFRITHNICLDIMRIKHRRKNFKWATYDAQAAQVNEHTGESMRYPIVSQLKDKSPCPSEKLVLQEQLVIIESSLQKLSLVQREVIILHDIEGFSYKEIARLIGTNIGTVRSRLHYGRAKLRHLLNYYFSSFKAYSVNR